MPSGEHVGLGKVAQSFERVRTQGQGLLDLGHRFGRTASGHEQRAQAAVGIGKIWEKRDDLAIAALGLNIRSGLMLHYRCREEFGKSIAGCHIR